MLRLLVSRQHMVYRRKTDTGNNRSFCVQHKIYILHTSDLEYMFVVWSSTSLSLLDGIERRSSSSLNTILCWLECCIYITTYFSPTMSSLPCPCMLVCASILFLLYETAKHGSRSSKHGHYALSVQSSLITSSSIVFIAAKYVWFKTLSRCSWQHLANGKYRVKGRLH
jgi:hypothetical protein